MRALKVGQQLLAIGLLASTAAQAAIFRPESGNGELFLNVVDTVATVSYTFDLGIRMDDFFVIAQQNEGYQRFFVLDSPNWNSFLGQVNPARLEWSVVAFDSTGGAGAGQQRLFSTVTQGSEATIGSTTNNNFSQGVNNANVQRFFNSLQIIGTHGTLGVAPDFSVNGDAVANLASSVEAESLAYYGNPLGLGPRGGSSFLPFSATNPVGRSSWFYYVTRSSTSNLATARVLVDEFDNGNSAGPANGRDGYWGFIQATDPATTLPEWQGKYLLSFTLPAFSPVLLTSTRQFAAAIDRTEYSGGYFIEPVAGLAGAGGLEIGAAAAITALGVAALSADDTGLPALLSPVPEPRTAGLFAIGLVWMGWALRRRRTAAGLGAAG